MRVAAADGAGVAQQAPARRPLCAATAWFGTSLRPGGDTATPWRVPGGAQPKRHGAHRFSERAPARQGSRFRPCRRLAYGSALGAAFRALPNLSSQACATEWQWPWPDDAASAPPPSAPGPPFLVHADGEWGAGSVGRNAPVRGLPVSRTKKKTQRMPQPGVRITARSAACPLRATRSRRGPGVAVACQRRGIRCALWGRSRARKGTRRCCGVAFGVPRYGQGTRGAWQLLPPPRHRALTRDCSRPNPPRGARAPQPRPVC